MGAHAIMSLTAARRSAKERRAAGPDAVPRCHIAAACAKTGYVDRGHAVSDIHALPGTVGVGSSARGGGGPRY